MNDVEKYGWRAHQNRCLHRKTDSYHQTFGLTNVYMYQITSKKTCLMGLFMAHAISAQTQTQMTKWFVPTQYTRIRKKDEAREKIGVYVCIWRERNRKTRKCMVGSFFHQKTIRMNAMNIFLESIDKTGFMSWIDFDSSALIYMVKLHSMCRCLDWMCLISIKGQNSYVYECYMYIVHTIRAQASRNLLVVHLNIILLYIHKDFAKSNLYTHTMSHNIYSI